MRIHKNIIIFFITVFSVIAMQQHSVAQDAEEDASEYSEKGNSKNEPQATGMTQAEMAIIIGDIAGEYQGSPSNIQFEIDGAPIMLVSDTRANRMRLLAPIMAADDMTQEHVAATLVSNFHLALDARYAVGNGILYSAFIHPLKELTRAQLESAVRQVATLRSTFGTSYTSGELSFGGQREPGQEI